MERLMPLACIIGTFIVAVSIVSTKAFNDITFYEPFDLNWKGRWFVSKNNEYRGKWKYEKSQNHDDYGLVVGEKAKKYGISYNLPFIADPNEVTLTFQYDVRFQKGIDCAGAYLKFLLPKDDETDKDEVDNETPYSIMFGADKCGSTNKVHFIFRHKNPINNEFVEHHMQHPALVEKDRFTHVYTATLYPHENRVKVFVDGQIAKNCDFMGKDFEPLIVPPIMIPDPLDEKPSTWDDRQKIPDPNAEKPKEWDENAPRRIVDVDAKKPKGWLDDELEEIDNPDSEKPKDWNEEEDGRWEPEKIDNPVCDDAPGCGPWTPPMKNNPAFKGKWTPPLIDNPDYNGNWEAKQIPNPNYFQLTRPKFEKIGRVGIEIWSMDDGIVFDNILITDNESFAAEIRSKTWAQKIEVEKQTGGDDKDEKMSFKEIIKHPFSIKKRIFGGFYKMIDWLTNYMPFVKPYKYQLVIIIKTIEENLILLIGFLGTIPILFISIYSLTYAKKDLSKSLVKVNTTYSNNANHTTSSNNIIQKPIENIDKNDSYHEFEENEELIEKIEEIVTNEEMETNEEILKSDAIGQTKEIDSDRQ